MALTDTAVRNLRPKAKPFKISDERGLHLLVNPNGSKLWRLKYRVAGKEKLLALGGYPEVSLRDARQKCTEARELLARDVDPSAHRQLKRRQSSAAAGGDTFRAVALEWYAKHAPGWATSHSEKVLARFENDVFPWIGDKPVASVKAPELLAMLRRVEGRGVIETAHRVKQACGNVFRYAIATGRADRDPSQDLKGAIPPSRGKHFASITEPRAVGELLRALDTYPGSFVTACALKLAPLVFVRPGELRQAEWPEIDLSAAEWRIPGTKTKMRSTHIVPLSKQAVEVLKSLEPLTRNGRYVFPGEYHRARPMSENTVLAALRRLGFSKEQMTGHGFRHLASTLLNEHGWHRDAIERQLGHADRDAIRATYNYAEHLPERRKMMQWWADYLDGLKAMDPPLLTKREASRSSASPTFRQQTFEPQTPRSQ